MSTKGTFLLALVCGLVMAGGFLWLFDPTKGVQPLQQQPLSLTVEVPLPKTLETQIASLVENQNNELVAPTPTIAVSQAVIPTATPMTPAEPVPSASETIVDPQVVLDKKTLDKRYAEFAYIEFGWLSTKKMATFHNNSTGEKEKTLEGGDIHGLRLEAVEQDHVLLSYGKSGAIRKPRVEFDIKNEPGKVLTEEEQAARALRYQELFGNRFMIAAQEADPTGQAKPPRLPSPAEEQEARQKYRETYGLLFQRMSQGDPTIDLRDVPNPDLNFDETVKRYFETNWPGQVEVTTEEESPSGTTTNSGTSGQ
jgi:hypothetical protein